MIVAREPHIHIWKVRPDFLVTKNKEKYEKFLHLGLTSKLSESIILGEIKRKKDGDYSQEEVNKLREELEKENPEAIIYTSYAEKSIIIYDQGPILREYDNYLINNFCLVEVKTSALGRYPRIQQNVFTPGQRKHSFYDHILRIKLETNFENGFIGTIHEDDVRKLLSDPKLK